MFATKCNQDVRIWWLTVFIDGWMCHGFVRTKVWGSQQTYVRRKYSLTHKSQGTLYGNENILSLIFYVIFILELFEFEREQITIWDCIEMMLPNPFHPPILPQESSVCHIFTQKVIFVAWVDWCTPFTPFSSWMIEVTLIHNFMAAGNMPMTLMRCCCSCCTACRVVI